MSIHSSSSHDKDIVQIVEDSIGLSKTDTRSSRASRASKASRAASDYQIDHIYGDMDRREIALARQITRETILSAYQDKVRSRASSIINGKIDPSTAPPPPLKNGGDGSQFLDVDPELVTWDGDDDPANPQNWPTYQKIATTVIVSLYTFVSPLTSSIISPAVPAIAAEYNETRPVVQSLMVSIMILAWAICPLFVAPLSEMYGRKIVMDVSIVVLLAFTLGCGGAQNTAQMAVCRFFAGVGGAAPLSVGAGVLADLYSPQKRGTALAWYAIGPTVGPVVAPIAAGWIVQQTNTWRWVMWVDGIFIGCVAVCGFLFYSETYPPVLLQRKAKKLRKESGNDALHTIYDIASEPLSSRLYTSMTRPLRILVTHPIVMGLGLFMAFTYGFMYIMIVTFPALWTERYGFSLGIMGLTFIGMGVGFLAGTWFWCVYTQKVYIKLRDQNGGVPKPEFRLPCIFAAPFLECIGLIWYGWSAEKHVHWIMPIIGTGIFAFAVMDVFQTIQTYLIDMNPRFSASYVASASLFRSLFGFAMPLFGRQMYDAMGYGWANTMCGILAVVLGLPFPIIVWFYGERIRNRFDKKLEASQAKKDERNMEKMRQRELDRELKEQAKLDKENKDHVQFVALETSPSFKNEDSL